jgi:hypothetical protein
MKTKEEIEARIAEHQKLRDKIGKHIERGTITSEEYEVDDQLIGAMDALKWILA